MDPSNRSFLGAGWEPPGPSMRVCAGEPSVADGSGGGAPRRLNHGLRQPHHKHRPSTRGVLRADLSAVGAEDAVDDREAQTGACLASLATTLGAPEAIEEAVR